MRMRGSIESLMMIGSGLIVLQVGVHRAEAALRATGIWRCPIVSTTPLTGNALRILDGQLQGPDAGLQPATVQCPIDSDTTLSHKDSGAKLTASGFSNGTGGFKAKACYTFHDGGGTGGLCDTSFSSSGSGLVQANLPVSIWQGAGANDYPFVSVTLQAALGNSYNMFWGYTLSK